MTKSPKLKCIGNCAKQKPMPKAMVMKKKSTPSMSAIRMGIMESMKKTKKMK